MNLKLKAALIVASVLGVGMFVSFISSFLPWYVLPALLIAFLVYIMYDLVLTKLNYDAKIEEMSKRY